jgi:hypothetical protein
VTYRSLAGAIVFPVLALVAAPLAGQTSSNGNAADAKPYVQPRTADGQPDISGYWATATYTPLERPQNVTKEYYTLEEVIAAEERAKEREEAPTLGVHYDNSQFGLTRSQITFARSLRTSLIVDPPDGRIPPQLAEAVERNAAIAAARKKRVQLDAVQNMMYDDRCIVQSGILPPMYISGYLPNFQIIQSPGYVTILTERLHNARVIPLDGRPFPPANVRSWQGTSRGRWEGKTLVVETRNTNGRIQAAANGQLSGQPFSGATEDLRIIERFTRTGEDTITLRFTVEDARTWAQPWTAEVPVTKMEPEGHFFEMACAEGNHSVANMLRGARLSEQQAAEAARKSSSN